MSPRNFSFKRSTQRKKNRNEKTDQNPVWGRLALDNVLALHANLPGPASLGMRLRNYLQLYHMEMRDTKPVARFIWTCVSFTAILTSPCSCLYLREGENKLSNFFPLILFSSFKSALFLSKRVKQNRNKVGLFQSKCVHTWSYLGIVPPDQSHTPPPPPPPSLLTFPGKKTLRLVIYLTDHKTPQLTRDGKAHDTTPLHSVSHLFYWFKRKVSNCLQSSNRNMTRAIPHLRGSWTRV